MADYLQGISPTVADTVAQFTLGTKAIDPRTRDFPDNEIQYVRAANAIAAGDGLIVLTDQTDEPYAYTPCTATGQILRGVAHATIGSGSFGWVTTKGKATVTITAVAVAAGDRLASGASGDVATIAFTTTYGQAEAAIAAGVRVMALDSASSTALSVKAWLA